MTEFKVRQRKEEKKLNEWEKLKGFYAKHKRLCWLIGLAVFVGLGYWQGPLMPIGVVLGIALIYVIYGNVKPLALWVKKGATNRAKEKRVVAILGIFLLLGVLSWGISHGLKQTEAGLAIQRFLYGHNDIVLDSEGNPSVDGDMLTPIP